jgi:hypothetical protein
MSELRERFRWCPECGTRYDAGIVACPSCRAVLVAEPPAAGGAPVVIHKVPDAAAGALLAGLLEHHGLRVHLRSATLPGYGNVRRDWGTTAWGELLVAPEDADEAREVISEYLSALERGGQVRDADVEGGSGAL